MEDKTELSPDQSKTETNIGDLLAWHFFNNLIKSKGDVIVSNFFSKLVGDLSSTEEDETANPQNALLETSNDRKVKCNRCNGEGTVRCFYCNYSTRRWCRRCNGTGICTCPLCYGEGFN